MWLRSIASCALGFVALGCAGASSEPDEEPADVHDVAAEQAPIVLPSAEPHEWSARGCTRAECHGQIEPIRRPGTEMLDRILARGDEVGDPDGCVVCHGGTPNAETVELAHAGAPETLAADGGPDAFFTDPASPWVNARTCGQCHIEHVRAQWTSLMMTEAGKIQGTTWGFGALEGYEHTWANYDAEDDPHGRLGTDAYVEYMRVRRALHPNVYPERVTALPDAPRTDEDLDALRDHPEQSAFTYIRTECNRCHLGVRGRFRRGDYRGIGCAACHIPYGNEGLYEGDDATLSREEPGHPLVHAIQATRDALVYVDGVAYSGIPVETCTTCHNRGKRIGVSYQGLMESAWGSPYTEGGGGQIDLHSKHYISMEQDVHYQRGMLCQDCHTSLDVHGDGALVGANLGAVEIECTDCHGTPDRFPWELPLGYGDEGGLERVRAGLDGPARGTAREVPEMLRAGAVAEVRDGYVLSARGNPMPEVVRDGDRIVVHTASGRDLELTPLRALRDEHRLSAEAETAMVRVGAHLDRMECYTCHTQWAPQCYGCHIRVDYSSETRGFDWVAAGHLHMEPEHRTDGSERGYPVSIPGEVTELRSYMRWEDPPLGVNGEGRVSPIIPGCQTTVTVIGRDGEDIIRNHIFRTPANTEGGGPEGQLAIDMSPVTPHTVGHARSCESCHTDDRALGYGIPGPRRWNTGTVVDLTSADGRVLPRSARAQVEPIEGLDHDWSAFVDRDGTQLQTVGSHFRGSGPLSDEQRARMSRAGVCVGCHQEIPDGSLAVSALHHAAEMSGQMPATAEEHTDLLTKIALTAAWAQVGGGALGGAGLVFGVGLLIRRLRRRRSRG